MIFESLNSTGLDLTQADLIRNFVLMRQDEQVQTQLYQEYWQPIEKAFGREISDGLRQVRPRLLPPRCTSFASRTKRFQSKQGFPRDFDDLTNGPDFLDESSAAPSR